MNTCDLEYTFDIAQQRPRCSRSRQLIEFVDSDYDRTTHNARESFC